MFALPSLLAVAIWFTKPPLGSQARITVNNPAANTIFQIVGINKDGIEVGRAAGTPKREQVLAALSNIR